MSYNNDFGPDGPPQVNGIPDIDIDNENTEQAFDDTNQHEEVSAPIEEQDEPAREQEEEHFESPVHKKTRLDTARARINQITREKYQALDALERMKQQNDYLQNLNAVTTQAASKAYTDKVMYDLDRATREKTEALESGDIPAQVKADLSMNQAVTEYNKLKDWETQTAYQNQQNQQNQNYNYNGMAPPPTMTKAEREYSMHNWFNSKEYFNEPGKIDRALAQNVQGYVNEFDARLYNNGMQDYIGTPEYLEIVDNHINALKEEGRYNDPRRGQLNMNQPRQSVAPARSGYNGNQRQPGQRDRTQLSRDEMDMMRRLGVKEDRYRQEKSRIAQEDRLRNDQYRRGR